MYNQPSSQSPAMFGSQSGGAQMQSAPNLPPGNAPGREYFNHSMATFTNAMQPPTGMVPQGISSLVPGYYWGGGVSAAAADAAADAMSYDAPNVSAPDFGGAVDYGYTGDENVQASLDAAQADFDAAAEAAAASAVENDIGFNQADYDAAVAAAESAAAIELGQTDSLDPSLSSAASQIAAIMTSGNTDGENSGPVVNSFLDTLSNSGNNATSIVPTLGTGGIEGYDALAASIAQDQDQAAVDSLNDASRGATAQTAPAYDIGAITAFVESQRGGPPVTSTGGQTNPTEIDFSTEALNSLQDIGYDVDGRSGGVTGSYYQGAGATPSKGMSIMPFGTIYDKPTAEAEEAVARAQEFEQKGFGRFLPGAKTVTQNPYTGEVSKGYGFGFQDAVGFGLGALNPVLGLGYSAYRAGQPTQVGLDYSTGLGSRDFGNPDMDMANVSLPERVLAVDEPDAGDPDGGNSGDNGGDNGGGSGGSDPNTSQYALNPLVYQAYANLGLPVPGNVPPYRRVNIPTSRFVV